MKYAILSLTILLVLAQSAMAATKVFLLAGQSNMAGEGKVLELPAPYNKPQTDVKFWKDGQWVALRGGFGDGDKGNLFGPEVSFGFALRHFFPNDDVYLVKYGLTSTDLAVQWSPDGKGKCYNTFRSAVTAAMKNLVDAGKSPTIAGMIWMQGENDALNSKYAAAYQKNLDHFIARVRSDFNVPTMPFVAARVLPCYGAKKESELVRDAQRTLPSRIAGTKWVDTDDLPLAFNGHYGTQGQLTLGFRFAKAFAPKAIQKHGTVDCDLVETTPFVFNNHLYWLEWLRPEHATAMKEKSQGYLRIFDPEAWREVSRFGEKCRFPCAYVENGTAYVVGTEINQGWYGNTLRMFTSHDLKNWNEQPLFSHPDFGLCNTSLCKAGDRYVLSIEVNSASKDRPHSFAARFLESNDLVHWTLTPAECRHGFDRYTAPHCLRWHAGWFYLFYLEANKPNGYEQYVTRSQDLIHWQPSPLNPVLAASPEDRQFANPRLSDDERKRVNKAIDCNNSDIDFCDWQGRLHINYSWGNQQGKEFIGTAEFPGTTAEFLEFWFPRSSSAVVPRNQ
jgi:hypothetical protein